MRARYTHVGQLFPVTPEPFALQHVSDRQVLHCCRGVYLMASGVFPPPATHKCVGQSSARKSGLAPADTPNKHLSKWERSPDPTPCSGPPTRNLDPRRMWAHVRNPHAGTGTCARHDDGQLPVFVLHGAELHTYTLRIFFHFATVSQLLHVTSGNVGAVPSPSAALEPGTASGRGSLPTTPSPPAALEPGTASGMESLALLAPLAMAGG